MSAWQILLPAFVFSLLLIATHTYLGLHVLARGIVFVDLALAQFAALGASLSFLAGQGAHGMEAQGFAFAAALCAALGFSLLRRIKGKTTREVIIGSAYVIATALSILVLSRSVQGMEELKSLFNGSILWVGWREIGIVAAVYTLLAVAHGIFHRRFHTSSFGEDGQVQIPFAWELAFFASFAVVITLAVGIAGILVVFAFLIIPAFSASLIAYSFRGRLLIGWTLGTIGSLAGLTLAYMADLPIGATVVSVLGLLPIGAAVARGWHKNAPPL